MGKSNGCLLWIVVGIGVVLFFGQFLGPIMHSNPKTKEFKTVQELESVRGAAYLYWKANGKLPSMIGNASFTKDVLEGNQYMVPAPWELNAQHELVDSWGTPLKVSSPVERTIFIDSAGPDKTWGTVDDIQDHTQIRKDGGLTGIIDPSL
ncbi:MAG: hypothetical protein LV480_08130 [Methylacidiphilales bacterium]|nr:hypothetical protein [Candidatus Methylacidiphilales bacterium]